jgi:hypothetical protein
MNLHGIERHQVMKLAENKKVERSMAEELLKVSVYWYHHPSGFPVHAPNHVKHIYSSSIRPRIDAKAETKSSQWSIDFGANTFGISTAILRCQSALLEFLNTSDNGYTLSIEQVKQILRLKIRQSVMNYDGYEYNLYPINYDDHMIFGASSVCVNDFINHILRQCQTFKRNHQRFAICPVCMKKFKNKLDLNYHQHTAGHIN